MGGQDLELALKPKLVLEENCATESSFGAAVVSLVARTVLVVRVVTNRVFKPGQIQSALKKVYGLPWELMSDENAATIGNALAGLEEIDPSLDNIIRKESYLRLKVRVDLNLPLVTGFFFKVECNIRHWVHFKYEGLQEFCYLCGVMGHITTRCIEQGVLSKPRTFLESGRSHGPHLRAAPKGGDQTSLRQQNSSPSGNLKPASSPNSTWKEDSGRGLLSHVGSQAGDGLENSNIGGNTPADKIAITKLMTDCTPDTLVPKLMGSGFKRRRERMSGIDLEDYILSDTEAVVASPKPREEP
ncbi:hypothetical protein Tsubulata_018606 [Turnera subulata]|uniref:CCHC-type domain-containing protein n=1 Tax=Turnera subulata TaxID=218843 RepID=A0A9Q0GJB9_9ROSI|nr:hypothetical protein Tsubulata_018606 [Turnera subulata]